VKLYIKQKVFSLGGRFSVFDYSERPRWSAEGEIFTIGRKLHVFDANGREVALIRRKLLSFLPCYHIETGGYVYTISRELSLFKPRYYLDYMNWTISGDFFAHEYEIADAYGVVMRMSKHWFTWGDSYELDIAREEHELLALCVALAVDCMRADADSSASSAST
jgi:uncharacterized protein YxjI